MGELDIRILLRLLKDPDPDPMAERLMEMYREWCREQGITPSSKRDWATRNKSASLGLYLVEGFNRLDKSTPGETQSRKATGLHLQSGLQECRAAEE